MRSQRRSVSCRLREDITSSCLKPTGREDAGRTTLASADPRTPPLPSTARHRSAILPSLAKTRTVKHLSPNLPRRLSPSPSPPTDPRSDSPPSISPIARRRLRGMHRRDWDWGLDLQGAGAAAQAAARSSVRDRQMSASLGHPGARAGLPASVEGLLLETGRSVEVGQEAAPLSSPPSTTRRRTVSSLEYTQPSSHLRTAALESTLPSTPPSPPLPLRPQDSTSQFLLCFVRSFPSPLPSAFPCYLHLTPNSVPFV